MKHQHYLFAAALFIGCAAGSSQAQGLAEMAGQPPAATASSSVSTQAQERRLFAEALHLYRSGRWSAAYARFAALADRGHVRAARIALTMLRDGPDRYGTQWSAEAPQVQAWERATGRQTPSSTGGARQFAEFSANDGPDRR
jgi:hypothetical protein